MILCNLQMKYSSNIPKIFQNKQSPKSLLRVYPPIPYYMNVPKYKYKSIICVDKIKGWCFQDLYVLYSGTFQKVLSTNLCLKLFFNVRDSKHMQITLVNTTYLRSRYPFAAKDTTFITYLLSTLVLSTLHNSNLKSKKYSIIIS